ncbi:MAG: tetratricopeptide repeat protein, partial [Acidimicrobiales bacterium]
RCLSYGDGTSLWPLLEMLRASARLVGTETDEEGRARLVEVYGDGADAKQVIELLAPLAGLGGTPAAIEQVQWALRGFLEALARAGPVIWVVEDLHWAEPAFLSLIEDVVDWARDAPLVVLCLARLEFLDDHPTWGGGKLNVTTMLLKPMSRDESAQLVAELLDGAALPADALDRVVSGAGGTPLFVEHLLAMLVDDGVLQRGADGWHLVAGQDAVTVPPTIGALLAARLERLSPGERQVLDAGSVVGQLFYAGAVAELTGLATSAVAEHLRSLARKEMVRSERSDMPGEDGFVFTHILVRDSAYQALPKLRRANLHERLARWLDKRADVLSGGADDFVGHHLAEAVVLRRAMGEVDGGIGALAEEAAKRQAAAAWRLMATDLLSASALYARAADLVPGTLLSLDLRCRQGVALFRAQEMGASRAVLDGVLGEAEHCGDPGLFLRARLAWVGTAAHTEAALTLDEISRTAAEALEYFGSTGDDEGLALAYSVSRQRLNLEARWEPMVEVAEKMIYHAKRCGDRQLFEEAYTWRYAGLLAGPRRAGEVLGLLRHEAEVGDIGRTLTGSRRMAEGPLLAFLDRPGEARAALAEAGTVFEEMHSSVHLFHLAFTSALTEQILGDYDGAERHLTYIFDELVRRNERSYLSTVAPLLGEIKLRQGQTGPAADLARMGRSLALAEDVVSQSQWRMLLAKVAAREGDGDQALPLAAEAVEWVERSDQLSWIADVYMGTADVQLAAGRPEEARASVKRALELYEAKGDVPDSRRARRRLADPVLA